MAAIIALLDTFSNRVITRISAKHHLLVYKDDTREWIDGAFTTLEYLRNISFGFSETHLYVLLQYTQRKDLRSWASYTYRSMKPQQVRSINNHAYEESLSFMKTLVDFRTMELHSDVDNSINDANPAVPHRSELNSSVNDVNDVNSRASYNANVKLSHRIDLLEQNHAEMKIYQDTRITSMTKMIHEQSEKLDILNNKCDTIETSITRSKQGETEKTYEGSQNATSLKKVKADEEHQTAKETTLLRKDKAKKEERQKTKQTRPLANTNDENNVISSKKKSVPNITSFVNLEDIGILIMVDFFTGGENTGRTKNKVVDALISKINTNEDETSVIETLLADLAIKLDAQLEKTRA
ncbi:MAG: hypothetical protein EOP45_18525 [Sphingobacteriaceae bacterium]|nr:MAG: hypothetical protein EOP45_18525 [Sphingobacteriaceae bacterium]